MDKRLLDLLESGYWEPDICPTPNCNGHMLVCDAHQRTRTPGRNRVRECSVCGHKIKTIEITEEPAA